MSNIYKLTNGISQGSVIRQTLLNIIINDLPEIIQAGIGISLFADYCDIWAKYRRLKIAVERTNEALRNFRMGRYLGI